MSSDKNFPMKVLIIGLGSMGNRRLRLLREFFPDFQVAAVDCRADRREETFRKFSCPVYEGFEEGFSSFRPDAIIVSTPPDAHSEYVLFALESGIHSFSELDLLDNGYEKYITLEKQPSPVVFLSSTMLFRGENRWIGENHEKTGRKKLYTYHVGQYLPDWHPWEKYDEFFVGDSRTNALREILCIELPWLTRSFGDVEDFRCRWGRISSLNLPYPDTCQILLTHSGGTLGCLTLDCVSRQAVRDMRIDGEKGMIRWQGTMESLQFFAPGEAPMTPLMDQRALERHPGYAEFISEGPYLEELRAFFDRIAGKAEKYKGYSYEEHRKILFFADELENEWRSS